MSATTDCTTPSNNSTAQIAALLANLQIETELAPPVQGAATLRDVNGNVVAQVGTDGSLYDGKGSGLLGGNAALTGTIAFTGGVSSSSSYITATASTKWARNIHTLTTFPTNAASLLLSGSVPGQTGEIVLTGPASGSGVCSLVLGYFPWSSGGSSGSSVVLQFQAVSSGAGVGGSLGSLLVVGSAGSIDKVSWQNLIGTVYASVARKAS